MSFMNVVAMTVLFYLEA